MAHQIVTVRLPREQLQALDRFAAERARAERDVIVRRSAALRRLLALGLAAAAAAGAEAL